MKKHFELILISTLMAVIVLAFQPAGAWAQADDDFEFIPGKEPSDVEIYNVPHTDGSIGIKSTEELPDAYNSADQEWYEQAISMKSQGKTGLCWAFSTTTAAEISYAKEMYETYGSASDVKETSPAHLAYFAYHRVNDPLGNTDGDLNSKTYWTSGGTFVMAMQHLATWSGLGEEETTPFADLNNSMAYNTSAGTYTAPDSFSYDDLLAYEDCMTLQECIYYNTYQIGDQSMIDINGLKSLIYKYGAATVSIVSSVNRYFDTGSNSTGKYFYNPTSTAVDHAVTVVGWDDDYPVKSNANGDAPTNKGAWIIQNSWGSDHNDDGFFYMSYESKGIFNDEIAVYDMQPADAYDYNYQYDGNANHKDTSKIFESDIDEGDKAANVFEAENTIELKAVGFTEYNNGQTDYVIDIYKDLIFDDDPESGTLVCSNECTTYTPGYKTFELDSADPILISKGEKYSVVITFKGTTYFGVESTSKDDATYTAHTEEGQSFYKDSSGDWVDMINYDSDHDGCCFRIKAFADEHTEHFYYKTEYDPATFDHDGKVENKCICGEVLSEYEIIRPDMIEDYCSAFTYTGKAIKPEVVIYDAAGSRIDPAYYTVEYTDNVNAGTATVTAIFNGREYEGFASEPFTIVKAANPLSVSGKTATVKYKKLKKKKQTLALKKVLNVRNNKGTLSFVKVSGNKKIKINSKTGKVTVKKKLKKGKYKVKVKVRSSGNSNYEASAWRTVTFTIKVK